MLPITFVAALALPSLDELFPAWLPLHDDEVVSVVREDAVDAPSNDDAPDPRHYATMKRVPIRGVIDPEVVELAKTLLTLPMGDERVLVVHDKAYAFRLELHYHPPGFANGPTGWHKGVTVYELVDEATGRR